MIRAKNEIILVKSKFLNINLNNIQHLIKLDTTKLLRYNVF